VYIQETSNLLKIAEQVLLTELNKILIQERRKNEKEKLRDLPAGRQDQEEPAIAVDPVQDVTDNNLPTGQAGIDTQSMVYYQERETIRLLLNYANQSIDEQKLSSFLLNELEDVEFANPVFKQIFEDYKNGLATGTVLDNQFFLHQASEPVKRAVTDLITNRYETSTHWGDKYKIFFPKENDILNQMALTNVLRLKFRVVQKMMDDNLAKVKVAEQKNDWDELDKALETQAGLKKAESELAGLLGIVVAK
jgi:DNA primase